MSEPTDDSLVDKLDKLCDGIVAVLEEGGAAPEPPKPAPGDPAPEPEPEPETVHYSRGRDKYDAYPEQRTAASFEAFVAAVLADRSQRKGLAYVAGPFAIGADGRHHRCKEGILPRRFLALDLDGSTPDGFAEVCMYLVAYRGFGYLTARHTPARPRARFILELSRPVSGAEGACLGTALQRRIEARLGNGVLEWDKSVYEGHQPVYTPLVGAKDMHYDGAPVDVDQILNDAPPLERPGRAERAAAIASRDPVVRALADRKMIKRDHGGDGKLSTVCPREGEHTGPSGESTTVYYLPNFGGVQYGKFVCMHQHCNGRQQEDFLRALGLEPKEVWRAQAGGAAPYDDLPPLETYDQAAQDDARQHTAAAAPAGDESRSGNGSAPADCESRVVVVRGDSLRVEPIRCLWDGWLARGKLHILAGAPGAGKSTIVLTLAAVVTAGGRWPDGTECTAGQVLVWSGEDDPADTLLPRLLAAGGDPKRFHIVAATIDRDGPRQFDPATDIPALVTAAREIPECALVIVDPVVTLVPGDSHKNSEVRRALQPLVGFASELDAAVFGISHFTKGTAGRDPVERVTGSVAFGALPRVVMAAARVNEGDAERRIFCRAKSNIGPDTGGWEYRLDLADVPGAPGLTAVWARWGEVLEGSARDLLAEAETIECRDSDGESTARSEAEGWLRDTLKGGDSMDGKRLKKLASDSGIKERTLYRASEAIGVVTLPGGFGKPRRWHLCPTPGKGCHVCQDPEDPLVHEDLGTHGDPTPLKPSCGAGSTHVCQPPAENRDSTPLEPRRGAGSTHVCQDRQTHPTNTGAGTHGSNPGGTQVLGGSDAHVCQDRQCARDSAATAPPDGQVGGDGPHQEPAAGKAEERETPWETRL